MKVNKVPAILGVVTAVVVVVVVLLVSGGEDAKTPPPDDGAQSAQTGGDAAQGSGGEQSGGDTGGQSGGNGGGSQSAPDPEPVIEVRDGEVVGGTQELSFAPGDQIRFAVASDTADEIHFHGYDVYADIPAGGEGKIDTAAELEGVFEVELHDSGIEVAEVTVSP